MSSLASLATRTVELGYKPRKQFLAYHKRKQRYAVIVAHRRAGKTLACIADLIDAALRCTKEAPRYAYIAPYYAQAKDVAWEYLKRLTAPIPGIQHHETELRVDMPNGARIRLYGAENADRLRGIYLDGVVIDEPADIAGSVFPSIIRPALADREGWVTFIGTLKGRNTFWRTYEAAVKDPDWYTSMLKASQTGLIPAKELAAAARSMPRELYAQEFECDPQAAVQGAYYGKILTQLEADGHLCRVDYEPRLRVNTAWDLGIADSTAIWFYQQSGPEIRVIDYYEASGAGLDHYARVLANKDYLYGDHYVPHDAAVRDLGTGLSRLETLRSLGVRSRLALNMPVEDGINAGRVMLPRCYFDERRCADGIDKLRLYRREYNDKLQSFHVRPLHDYTSHAADAMRYMAVSMRDQREFVAPEWREPVRVPEGVGGY